MRFNGGDAKPSLDLYTTGTIFVAQRLCPSLAPGEDDAKWQECWNMCLHGLSRYSEQSHAASKCFKVLDLIDKQLFRLSNPGKAGLDLRQIIKVLTLC